jgi:hypothetical protein
MPLVVETGFGSSLSNAYLSVASADTYHEERGNDSWEEATFAAKEAAIIRASQWIDTFYKFRGQRTHSTQAMAWPRSGAVDDDGFEVEGLPPVVVYATAEAALRALQGDLSPDRERGGRVVRQKVGEVEVEYAPEAPAGTVYAHIDALLRGVTVTRTKVLRV